MKRPAGQVVEAMNRVAARPEGMLIRAYFQEAMDDINQRLLATADPVQLRNLQGEGRVFAMLLEQWKP